MIRRSPRMRVPLLISLLLHLGVLAALLAEFALVAPHVPPPLPDQGPVVQVLVGGGGKPGTPAAAPAPEKPNPAPHPAPPPAPRGSVTPHPPAAPPPAPPAVRLGGGPPGPVGHIEQNQNGPMRPAKGDKGNMPPVYPSASMLMNEHGDVEVLMHVDAHGRVTRVDIVHSSGSPRLDGAAVTALAKWHFTPAAKDGKPVPSTVPLVISFQ